MNSEALKAGQYALNSLRRGCMGNSDSFECNMKALRDLQSQGTTLEELGCNQQELDGFPRILAEVMGKCALKGLRMGCMDKQYFFDFHMDNLLKSLSYGLTLEELGTNQQEIDSFKKT